MIISENVLLNRFRYIDTAKAILICIVVLGHSGFVYSKYLFWFHMPAFFIISGFLHKEIKTLDQLGLTLKRKAISYFIPYFLYLLIITIVDHFINNSAIDLTRIFALLYGGRLIRGVYGVFWFITCLYLTYAAFCIINILFKSNKTKVSICILMYLLAHIESNNLELLSAILTLPANKSFPWNIDTILLAVPYYSIGYYLRKLFKGSNFERNVNKWLLFSIIISVCLIALDLFKVFNYMLDMKMGIYNNLLMDLIIPINFTLLVLFISKYIDNFSCIEYLKFVGINSLTIMYIHMPLNIFLIKYVKYNWVAYFFLGLAVPVLIAILFERYKLTKILFLGKHERKMKPMVI